MKRDVYRHLLKTYGNLPLLWMGVICEAIKTTLLRIVIVLVMAQVAAHLAIGDLLNTKHDILSVRTTDQRYKILLMNYYQKLIGKDMSFYRDHQTGYLAGLFRQHLDGTMALVRLYRGDIIRMIIALCGPVIVLVTINWHIGVVVGTAVLILSSYVLWASHRVHKYRKPAQEVYRKLTGEVADELTNAVAFKSSGGEAEANSKISLLAEKEMNLFWVRHTASTFFDLPRTLLTGIAIGLGFLLTSVYTSGTTESIWLIILIFTYLLQVMHSVADLPDLVARHDEHMSRVHPTLHYLDTVYETILDPKEPQELSITNGAISIRDIRFAYPTKGSMGKQIIFSGLNLEIQGGEHVGIVGLSGAGKSTLAGLLMRFDDVSEGLICIDGVDIRHVRQSDLRQKIAYVPQEPLLFHRSIKENINYFKKDATNEDVTKAAKIAHAHEFIIQLPEGYNTLVGERGLKLSGGQKQRIAIARAVLKHAPIIIFDEATSALDTESERIIQNALPEIIGNCTALVIAHRLSTVARLDRIIVMDNGKVVEQGSHQELLALSGRYAALWKKQSDFSG